MRKIIFSFLLFFSITCAYCQSKRDREEITAGDKGSYRFRETFDVLKENPNIQESPYAMWYEGVKIISGNFAHNQKNGLWKYANVNGVIFFQGNYTNDKKNGCWKYYKNQKPLAVVYFKNDKTDSLWQSFYEDGKIQGKQNYSNGLKNGVFQVFYEDGSPAIDATYKNDSIDGMEKTFYRDGTIRSVIEYKKGNAYNVLALNDSAGKPLDTGTLKDGTGVLKRYDSKGKLFSSMEYKKGLKNGVLKCYDQDGKLAHVYTYANDQLSGKQATADKDDNNYAAEKNTLPPFFVSLMPPVAQGDDAGKMAYNGMMAFIQYNVVYPESSKNARISGTVFLSFILDHTGTIIKPKVMRGVAADLDKEALRIISIMPQWSPAFENGLPVSESCYIPIKYTLR